jgi:hypothetical protein
MMGQGHVLITTATPPTIDDENDDDPTIEVAQQTEMNETELWSKVEKPRVRYDVEVVTKLVIYAGQYYRFPFLIHKLTKN